MGSDGGRGTNQRRKGGTAEASIQYNTIQYHTIPYNTIQYNTIQYNTSQLAEGEQAGRGPVGTGVGVRDTQGYSALHSVNVIWRIVGNGGDQGGEAEEALGIAPPMVSIWKVERSRLLPLLILVFLSRTWLVYLGREESHWIRLPSPLSPHTILRLQTVAADAFPLRSFCLHCVQMCCCDWFNKDLTGQ